MSIFFVLIVFLYLLENIQSFVFQRLLCYMFATSSAIIITILVSIIMITEDHPKTNFLANAKNAQVTSLAVFENVRIS